MNLRTGSFDTVAAIRHLAGQVAQLERRLAALETVAPSATMDAAEHGATLGAPRPAGETAGERGDPPRKRRAAKGASPRPETA
ncbi:MAG: hypothetical protein M5U01_10330 [Ardenticatenaceae bacterium]|nr:hypothetical protein [Ardenticatenaceae bacterium]